MLQVSEETFKLINQFIQGEPERISILRHPSKDVFVLRILSKFGDVLTLEIGVK